MKKMNFVKKSVTSTIMLLSLLCNVSVYAQQWHYYNPTLWFDINALEILGPGVIAVGGGWETNDSVLIMFQTEDYGLSWYENAHDGPAPWNKSIAFSDSLDGYGVCNDGRIIKTDDAGRNWGWPVTPINRDLNNIVYTGSGTYYIAGGNKTQDSVQTILKSNDYGSTWTVMHDTLGPWLRSLHFFDTLQGIAVGDGGVILSTGDGGNTWTTISAPVIRDFHSITFIGVDTGFIVGGSPAGMATILITVNGGASWSVLQDAVGGILKDISFANPAVGYIVGDSATVLKTTNAGLTWAPLLIDSTLTGNEEFRAVKFYDVYFGAVAGKGGKLFIYTDISSPQAYTMGTQGLLNGEVKMLAQINTSGHMAQYSFCYSSDSTFANAVWTSPGNIISTTPVQVSATTYGLNNNNRYYYFVKVNNIADTVFGDTLSFMSGNIFFHTMPATNVTYNSATLNGSVGHIPVSLNLSFVYGLSYGSMVNEIPATPFFINDSLIHIVSASLTGLTSNTNYFYQIKGTSATDTVFSMSSSGFYTLTTPIVKTLPASDISYTSAKLNGTVNANNSNSNIKFQYGTSLSYGNEIDATPAFLPANADTNVYAEINALLPDTFYHFRIKATNAFGTSYGQDLVFFTGIPEIPNFSFENWTEQHILYPDGWEFRNGIITQCTTACQNNYALKIQNDTLSSSSPGSILLGRTFDHGQTIEGGIPFNSRPDSVMGCFNFDIPDNDTALMLVVLKKQGIHLSYEWFEIIGSSHGDFVEVKFPIHYSQPGIPDSLIIGFTCADVFQMLPQLSYSSYLIVDNVRFIGTNESFYNNDFEIWDTLNFKTLDAWAYPGMNGPNYLTGQSNHPVMQTTDAQNGNFAVMLHSCLSPPDTMPGLVVTGTRSDIPNFRVNARHTYLTGFYKFFPVNNDTMTVHLVMFKNQNMIGYASLYVSEEVADYSPFYAEIQYFSGYDTVVPDSSSIQIRAFNNRPLGFSTLYIDNLSFDGFFSGLKNPAIALPNNFDFSIYPNPFCESATVSFSLNNDENISVRLFDLSGRQISVLADGLYKKGSHSIDLTASGLNSGFYICVINTSDKFYSKKIVVY